MAGFHPTVRRWFAGQFRQPSNVQEQAWAAIAGGQHCLIAAPTGAGKTLAGFLAIIDQLIKSGLEQALPDETRVLYISPLKALSNDIQTNLQSPLNGIRDELLLAGLPDVPINAWVRTGDTSQAERGRMRRQAPHIIVTTPESLYLLLTSASGREMLANVHDVIVDEIHALAGNKRGAHLSLSLQRLDALCQARQGHTPRRIGISATQKPIRYMANFLLGECNAPISIIDSGYQRERDLALEIPDSPLDAVMANEVWDELYQKLEKLITEHGTTLIFVNTRRLAERAAHHLAERLGEDAVTAHHGSLSRKHRLHAEQRLKRGELRALVATASLELGIDIGHVDLVCQLGSPRGIATFLQRVGRAGHRLDAIPKGRLFPLTQNDLLECVALLDAIRRDELDRIRIPYQPLDVLAQQIVAEVAAQDWTAGELYAYLRRAWPYRELTHETFEQILRMLSEGYSTRRGRRGAYLHRDIVNDQLRSRRGARLVALTNGGAIPDQFDYDVILQPEGSFVGSLNEDFAFESLPGDIFQLGNTSYRILKIERGKVLVVDAHGQPPNIPFWFGEAPGRSDELSFAVSRLLRDYALALHNGDEHARSWLQQSFPLSDGAARQLSDYLISANAALGILPDHANIILERFFDEAGDMHLVIHSSYGSRINRAWGLALRKRFCRQFNFELQAAATDNTIVLSLGPTHSFPLEEVVDYINKNTLQGVLTQALLDAPMFATRWRWNANISLAVPRNRAGKRVPAQFQRSDAEDLLAVVFPQQLACLENIQGEREIPDHPLVQQTLHDCLHDNMDVDGLLQLYADIEAGQVQIHCRDLPGPSILCGEILTARPYAFLDDGAAEERRTQNVQQPRFATAEDARALRQLDPQAIQLVREEAWPDAGTADELYDALILLGFVAQQEVTPAWQTLLVELISDRRVARVQIGEHILYAGAERLQELATLYPDAVIEGDTPVIVRHAQLDADTALINILHSRLECLGPVNAQALAADFTLPVARIEQALLRLESRGDILQGHFTPAPATQWCDRRLLARIHRYTLSTLRKQIQPVTPQAFMRFLFEWQHVSAPLKGPDALLNIVQQLEGFSLPAISWEQDILPARMQHYLPDYLDQLCNTGRVNWLRTNDTRDTARKHTHLLRQTGITLLPRPHRAFWQAESDLHTPISPHAATVHHLLQTHGASFMDELQQAAGLLPVQLEQALAELVMAGQASSDNYAGLRGLIAPRKKHRYATRMHYAQLTNAGRWSLAGKPAPSPVGQQVEHICRTLLKRYGIVFRKLLERETGLPSWRELLYCLRRLEARGEIRGGRFVSGFSGEQFALPEAIKPLRHMREPSGSGQMFCISAVDPLNLAGIITPGERIPAKHTAHILYRDGIPVAYQIKGKLHVLLAVDAQQQWEIQTHLAQARPGRIAMSDSRIPH